MNGRTRAAILGTALVVVWALAPLAPAAPAAYQATPLAPAAPAADLMPPAASAAESVGEVVWVRNQVTGTPRGGSAAPLAVADPLVLELEVATGRDSGVGMTFDPEGALQLGPEARIVIDRSAVDKATGRSQSALSVLLGKLRLALGRAFSGDLEVTTPTATIGIKGTTLTVGVAPGGDSVVWVHEGAVEVQAKAGGPAVRVEAGQLTVVAGKAPATPPTPFDPATGAAAGIALPPPLASPLEEVFDDSPLPHEIDNLPPDRGERLEDPSGRGQR